MSLDGIATASSDPPVEYGTNKVFQPVFDTYHRIMNATDIYSIGEWDVLRTDNPSASTVDLEQNG